MVKEATPRQLLISLLKKKIYQKYIRFVNEKSQKGDEELMKNFLEELKEFGLDLNKKDENTFYNSIVSFNDKSNMENMMELLKKYNKLF
jgi:hypothetical protein